MLLKWLVEISHVASIIIVFKLELENIVGSIKIIFGKFWPQVAWLLLKWLIEISYISSVKSLFKLASLLLKCLVEISHVALVTIMLILELVFNEKVESENIVDSIKIVFGKSLPHLAWLFLKWLIEISHVASVKSLSQLAWLHLKWLI